MGVPRVSVYFVNVQMVLMEANDPNVLQDVKLLHDKLFVSGKMLNARNRVSIITAQARKC